MTNIVDELRQVASVETGLLYSRRTMLNAAADEIERLRQNPTAISHVVGWRCDECGCHSGAFIDERKADGSFGPGQDRRCENCKKVHVAAKDSPSSHLEPVQDTWFIDRSLPVMAISGDIESNRVLKLHFRRRVSDEDRKAITDALNMYQRSMAEEPNPTPAPNLRGWQTMDTAPRDGTRFVGIEVDGRHGIEYARIYKWEGHPNYWHCKREGVCIRPEYQERYLWAPIPALFATSKEGE